MQSQRQVSLCVGPIVRQRRETAVLHKAPCASMSNKNKQEQRSAYSNVQGFVSRRATFCFAFFGHARVTSRSWPSQNHKDDRAQFFRVRTALFLREALPWFACLLSDRLKALPGSQNASQILLASKERVAHTSKDQPQRFNSIVFSI